MNVERPAGNLETSRYYKNIFCNSNPIKYFHSSLLLSTFFVYILTRCFWDCGKAVADLVKGKLNSANLSLPAFETVPFKVSFTNFSAFCLCVFGVNYEIFLLIVNLSCPQPL